MKKLVNRWKSGSRVNIDPTVAARELARIAKMTELTPTAVLTEARKKRNPLHSHFEWDDSVAAEKFRTEQAKYLIRSLEVTIIPSTKEPEKTVSIRQYVSLGTGIGNDKTNVYHPIEAVVADSTLRDQALRKVWNQLLTLKQQYEHLTELTAVWDAIGESQGKILSA